MPLAIVCGACAHHTATARATPASPAPAKSSVAQTMKRQALNAVDAGDGDYEAKVLRAKLSSNPKDVAVRLELAKHYWKAGYPEIALEHGRLAVERAPDSVEAHVALAKMLRDNGTPAEAAALLRDFAGAHAGEVEIWAWLGVVEDEAGDWKAGETAHRKAVALAPQRVDLLNNLGYCLLEQGRKSEAAETFRAALAIDPQSLIARNNLGMALSDKPKEAVLNWQSAAGPATAHNNMAVALIEQGKYPEARQEIQKALDYDRRNTAALNNLELLTRLDGKPAEIAGPRAPAGRWARFAAAWRHYWSDSNAQNQNNNSGSPVASTQSGTN